MHIEKWLAIIVGALISAAAMQQVQQRLHRSDEPSYETKDPPPPPRSYNNDEPSPNDDESSPDDDDEFDVNAVVFIPYRDVIVPHRMPDKNVRQIACDNLKLLEDAGRTGKRLRRCPFDDPDPTCIHESPPPRMPGPRMPRYEGDNVGGATRSSAWYRYSHEPPSPQRHENPTEAEPRPTSIAPEPLFQKALAPAPAPAAPAAPAPAPSAINLLVRQRCGGDVNLVVPPGQGAVVDAPVKNVYLSGDNATLALVGQSEVRCVVCGGGYSQIVANKRPAPHLVASTEDSVCDVRGVKDPLGVIAALRHR